MRYLVWVAVVALVFFLSWFVGGMLQQQNTQQSFRTMIYTPCQPIGVACEATFADATLQLEFTSTVVVMSPFIVRVNAQADIPEMYVQFRMKDMDMGVQRYRLLHKGNGLWESEVVLPVCSLARSDWTVILEVYYQKTWWRGEFDFIASNQL